MAETLRVEVLTPDRALFAGDGVTAVYFPAENGYLGILPGHQGLLTTLGVGAVVIERGGSRELLALSGGFGEVAGDKLILLADKAQLLGEVDKTAAQQQRQEAEKQLTEGDPVAALQAFQEAEAWLAVADGKSPV